MQILQANGSIGQVENVSDSFGALAPSEELLPTPEDVETSASVGSESEAGLGTILTTVIVAVSLILLISVMACCIRKRVKKGEVRD